MQFISYEWKEENDENVLLFLGLYEALKWISDKLCVHFTHVMKARLWWPHTSIWFKQGQARSSYNSFKTFTLLQSAKNISENAVCMRTSRDLKPITQIWIAVGGKDTGLRILYIT